MLISSASNEEPKINMTTDDTHILMDQHTFDTLIEYDPSMEPFQGQIWKVHFKGEWWLMERTSVNPNRTKGFRILIEEVA